MILLNPTLQSVSKRSLATDDRLDRFYAVCRSFERATQPPLLRPTHPRSNSSEQGGFRMVPASPNCRDHPQPPSPKTFVGGNASARVDHTYICKSSNAGHEDENKSTRVKASNNHTYPHFLFDFFSFPYGHPIPNPTTIRHSYALCPSSCGHTLGFLLARGSWRGGRSF